MFTELYCPNFYEVDLGTFGVVNSKELFTAPKEIFRIALAKVNLGRGKRLGHHTSFSLFTKEIKGTSQATEFLKHASEKWKKLSLPLKRQYKHRAELMNTAVGSDQKKPKAQKLKKLKRPRNAVSLFIHFGNFEKNLENYMEHCTQVWGNLSEDQKEPFIRLAKLDSERYEFEHNVEVRFSLVLGLLATAYPQKFSVEKKPLFKFFQEHLKESYIERGYRIPKNFAEECRKEYRSASKSERQNLLQKRDEKQEELKTELFITCLGKINVNFEGLVIEEPFKSQPCEDYRFYDFDLVDEEDIFSPLYSEFNN